jgi:hypothetical protein
MGIEPTTLIPAGELVERDPEECVGVGVGVELAGDADRRCKRLLTYA